MKTIFVTGATGAIGSVLARYLLAEPETRLRLLVRANSPTHLQQRLGELCRFWGIAPDDPAIRGRVDVIAGDVTQPNLGIDPATYERLVSEVSHAVHSAGNVKLNRSVDEARRSAVDSAGHVVSFAEACMARGSFRKLEFVSTVGVAGQTPGTVPERPLHHARTFRNSYEAAKAEAETFVLTRMDRGLPVTIHRPSMVVGDSRDGRIIQFQVFYYLCEFLSGRRTAGIVPDAGNVRLDIVPVDYVARGIQLSTTRDDAAGRVLHLCSGPSEAPRINQLAQRIREIFVAHGRPVPSCRLVWPSLLRTLLPVASRLVTGRTRRSLQALPHFLSYLDAAEQTFANVESQRFLSGAGLELPRVDSYLETILVYYLSHETASAAAGRASRGAA